jgi:carbon storage regulator
MLCLTRRKGERIIIDNGRIVVEVCEIHKNIVRIGVTADDSIPIHRQEIQQKIDAEKTPTVIQPAVCSHPDFGTIGYACRLLDCPVHGSRNRVMEKNNA